MSSTVVKGCILRRAPSLSRVIPRCRNGLWCIISLNEMDNLEAVIRIMKLGRYVSGLGGP